MHTKTLQKKKQVERNIFGKKGKLEFRSSKWALVGIQDVRVFIITA